MDEQQYKEIKELLNSHGYDDDDIGKFTSLFVSVEAPKAFRIDLADTLESMKQDLILELDEAIKFVKLGEENG